MSLTIEYIAGEDRLRLPLNSTDLEVLYQLSLSGLENECNIVLGMSEFGATVSSQKVELISAIDQLLKNLSSQKGKLPYTYKFRRTLVNEEASSGGSGCTVDGVALLIFAGFGVCGLFRVHSNGQRELVRDLRDERRFPTDDCGDILIYKRKKSINLLEILQEIKDFLLNHKDVQVITKTLG